MIYVGRYPDLLVFNQSVDDCDDKVFGESEVWEADTFGAVYDEGQVHGRTFALYKQTTRNKCSKINSKEWAEIIIMTANKMEKELTAAS